MPAIRRRDPGPSENLPLRNRLHRSGAAIRDEQLHGYQALTVEIESIRRIALGKGDVSFRKLHDLGAPGNKFQMLFRQIREEGMFPDNRLQRVNHILLPSHLIADLVLLFPDGPRFLVDINPHRTPSDATATANTTRSTELVVPISEFVHHPLAEFRARRCPHTSAVEIRKICCETGIPFANPLCLPTRQVRQVFYG